MSFSVPDSLFWTIVLFLVGLGLICIAGDKFVDAAVAIAKRLKIPMIVVGATIVSLGTTLPEILVSTTAAVGSAQSPEISVGNALGSIICNTALIAGIGFTAVQYLYLETQVMVAKQSAIYGFLAALPLFMIWLNLGWTIILYGAELSYSFQHANQLNPNEVL